MSLFLFFTMCITSFRWGGGETGPDFLLLWGHAPTDQTLGASKPQPPSKCSLSTSHVPSWAKGPEDAAVSPAEPAPWTLPSGF